MKRSDSVTENRGGSDPYCKDCPDREACHQGANCDFVRKVEAYFAHLNAVATGKGKPITMSNTSKTTTPADVAAKAAKDEKLVTTEVPAQGKSEDKTTGEKAKEVVEETTEAAKKTVKDRLTGLVEKAKDNKKFFVGVVTGVVGTLIVTALNGGKDEDETEVVELTIADEPDNEEPTSDDAV